ncbi:hypothetical protein MKX03_020525 [Papaver bracteatum]|nr:hypothetical protein MKX03_020525 [Papaver bracteatum]
MTSNSSTPTSTSPSKSNNNQEKPRFFDAKAKSLCWEKADLLIGRHPDRWRRDAVGNIISKRFDNCEACLCYKYDQIVPLSKGGEFTAENCQILQSRVYRYKSDEDNLNKSKLKRFSTHAANFLTDKELDIIEVWVYGDVILPGN